MANLTPEQQEQIHARLAERDRARHDKVFLATQVLGYDFQPEVHGELFAQYVPFTDGLPLVAQSATKDRLILWPRGHYKSTSVVVEVIQIVLNYPDVRLLLMQGTVKTTKNLLKEIVSHFMGNARNSRLQQLFPEFCGTKATLHHTIETFTVPNRTRQQLREGTVTVASPKATKTGQHYDAGFFDDLVNDQNYRNPELLQKVEEDFNMCLPLIDPGGYRYVTGTRYAFGDLYENIIRANANNKGVKWAISVKTCWSDDGKEVRFPQRGAPDGRVIGFTRELLLGIQRTDPAMFASQYLNQPLAASEQLFPEEMMTAALVNPYPLDKKDALPALSQAVLFIDLASSKSGYASDDSVILTGRTDSLGRLYVVDCAGGQWTPHKLAMQVIAESLKHRPLRVLIEKSASATYFMDYLRLVCAQNNVTLPLDYIKCSNVKDAKKIRIMSLEGLLRTGKLFFFMGLPRWDLILEQFTTFPKAKYSHDDYPDTVALMAQELGLTLRQRPVAPSGGSILAMMDQQDAAQQRMLEMSDPPDPGAGMGGGMGGEFGC